MEKLYIIQCAYCGKSIKSKYSHMHEIVICLVCANKTKLDFKEQIDKLYKRTKSDSMLDNLLKQAVKEYDSKSWYQKIRDYIKKYINILRL